MLHLKPGCQGCDEIFAVVSLDPELRIVAEEELGRELGSGGLKSNLRLQHDLDCEVGEFIRKAQEQLRGGGEA